MSRSIPPCLLLWLCAVVALPLCGSPCLGAGRTMAGWQAVLVAGDNAEPVFDNAVEAMSRWLGSHGLRAADIHRLSADPRQRDQDGEPASAPRILQRIVEMHPSPGEGCLVFITSHGQHDEGVWLAVDNDYLRPDALARALSAGCGGAPTVVIVSACYSGVFARGPMRAPNRIVLTAARIDRPSFGCQVGRTYTVFDECLLAALAHAPSWRATYRIDTACVRQHERRLRALPSQPRAFFGAAVRNLAIR